MVQYAKRLLVLASSTALSRVQLHANAPGKTMAIDPSVQASAVHMGDTNGVQALSFNLEDTPVIVAIWGVASA